MKIKGEIIVFSEKADQVLIPGKQNVRRRTARICKKIFFVHFLI